MYKYILFNADTISFKDLNKLLKELELNCIAKWLKHKFNDKRDIKELTQLIKSEYSLT